MIDNYELALVTCSRNLYYPLQQTQTITITTKRITHNTNTSRAKMAYQHLVTGYFSTGQILDHHDLGQRKQVSLKIYTELNLEGRGTQEGQLESLSNFSNPINIITLNINTDRRTQEAPEHLRSMLYGSRMKKTEDP